MTDKHKSPKLLRSIEFFAAIAAIVTIALWWVVEYPAIQEEREMRAWQLLNMKGPGGKQKALEFLSDQKIPVANVNLSYDLHGPAKLRFINLVFESGELIYVDLSGSVFSTSKLNNSHIERSDLSYIRVDDSNFSDTNFKDTDLTNSTFSNSMFYGAKLINVNVTGVDFTGSRGISKNFFNDNWAWSDNPPKNLPENVLLPTLIDPIARHLWYKIPVQKRPYSPVLLAEEELKKRAVAEAKRLAEKNRVYREPRDGGNPRH